MAEPARTQADSDTPATIPLTFKGLVACLALVLYGVAMATYVLAEREAMLREIAALDERQAVEEALKRAALAASNAMLALRQAGAEEDPAEAAREAMPFALEAVERALGAWRGRMPEVFAAHRGARGRYEALAARASRAAALELRESLETLRREIERAGAAERARREVLADEFRRHGERIALVALALGLGGLLVFGGVTAVFFARLAADLRALGTRARAIVSGYRGAPLEVARRDEVGALARDVNRLAADLAAREAEVAQARELRAHREKMAALGAMARSLSHEIGNPLAVIAALAQDGAASAPGAILEQTGRIARITRQIAEFSGPRADSPEPVDAGAMVAMVCDFMQFDPRFRATRIEPLIDPALPPLVVVPDQLSEVLMNLVQLGVEGDGGAPERLAVQIAPEAGGVAVRVACGAPRGDAARRERTRRLAQEMGGSLREGPEGIAVSLPAAT